MRIMVWESGARSVGPFPSPALSSADDLPCTSSRLQVPALARRPARHMDPERFDSSLERPITLRGVLTFLADGTFVFTEPSSPSY